VPNVSKLCTEEALSYQRSNRSGFFRPPCSVAVDSGLESETAVL